MQPTGRQVTVSENHSEDWDKRTKRPKSGVRSTDIGGRFSTQRLYVWAPTGLPVDYKAVYEDSVRIDNLHYHGPLHAYPPQGTLNEVSSYASTEGYLRGKGSEAIAKCKPTNSIADVATFLGELKSDGIPKLLGSSFWKKKTLEARDAGDELLSSEFGWKPLVSDIGDIISGVSRADEILSQYERDAGKVVRRRFEFPVEESRSEEKLSFNTVVTDPFDGRMLDSSLVSNVRRETYTYRKIWFSGAFTYHMPTENWLSRTAIGELGQKLSIVFGTDLTPEVVWNLAPWSWAVDWFSNLGDCFSNLSDMASDGLVMRYGYIMEHSIKRVRYYNPGRGGLKNPYLFISDVIAECETKQRYPASPFGFGVNWSGLSPRQLSIAAALGITRNS